VPGRHRSGEPVTKPWRNHPGQRPPRQRGSSPDANDFPPRVVHAFRSLRQRRGHGPLLIREPRWTDNSSFEARTRPKISNTTAPSTACSPARPESPTGRSLALRADIGFMQFALLGNTLLRRGLSRNVQISSSERRDCAGCRQAYDLTPRTWPLGHRESTASEAVRPRAQRASRASCCVVLQKSFYGRENPRLSDKPLEEATGILNWSLEGLPRRGWSQWS
jgi:hypothetical protein